MSRDPPQHINIFLFRAMIEKAKEKQTVTRFDRRSRRRRQNSFLVFVSCVCSSRRRCRRSKPHTKKIIIFRLASKGKKKKKKAASYIIYLYIIEKEKEGTDHSVIHQKRRAYILESHMHIIFKSKSTDTENCISREKNF
jgi:hypothetical protein